MSIHIDGNTTIRQLVSQYPQTCTVFENRNIDYCCGGAQRLTDVAQQRKIELKSLLTSLETALNAATNRMEDSRDWYSEPLDELARYIVAVHHSYTKKALPRLRGLLQKVLHAHGAKHRRLLNQVCDYFESLDGELTSHLMKEEAVLFPYIASLSEHARQGGCRPAACFESVQFPIRQMEHEHESAGAALAGLHEVTSGYTLPADACPTFAALYEGLQALEADLHRHIHLENNILFPRAVQLEGS